MAISITGDMVMPNVLRMSAVTDWGNGRSQQRLRIWSCKVCPAWNGTGVFALIDLGGLLVSRRRREMRLHCTHISGLLSSGSTATLI
jgi:hypothetical protein